MAATVEHVVLLKVRGSTDPSKIDAMLFHLGSLASLDVVSHLAVGPVLRQRASDPAAAGFTHFIHGRYASKPHLAAYDSHPDHRAVVGTHVDPICDDVMIVDWVADGLDLPEAPLPGPAVRLTLAKPKEGAAAAEVLAALMEPKESASLAAGALQVTCGENFSPMAKGYSVVSLSVLSGMAELEGGDEKGAVVTVDEKVQPLVESVIVVDFLLPPPVATVL